jgi:KDO2-lipid IV(A) lauroyltransferase
MLLARVLNCVFYRKLIRGKLKFVKTAKVIPKLFPERSREWQERIIKQNSLHYVKLAVEMLKARTSKTKRAVNRKIYVAEGRQHLERLLESGDGFIVLTLHEGNFEYAAAYIGMIHRPIYTPVSVSNTKGSRVMNWARERHNCNLIEVRSGAKNAARALAKMIRLLNQGEIIFLVADQRGTGGKFMGELFGKMLRQYGGPYILGQRTKKPFLPMYSLRDERDKIAVHFEKPFYLNGDELESDIKKVTGFFEKVMREHPEQYLWTKDRW